MSCVMRYISTNPLKQQDIYRGSPYEYEATAPVGQTIVLVTPLALAISGQIVKNPLSTLLSSRQMPENILILEDVSLPRSVPSK